MQRFSKMARSNITQKNYYKNLAEDFDSKFNRENPNHIYKIDEICRVFEEQLFSRHTSKLNILELGAGTGIHALYFAKTFCDKIQKFTISDLSPEMLDFAKARLLQFEDIIEFKASEAENFNSQIIYDGIYISGSMHHFESPENAIANIKKICAKNSLLVICEPIVSNPINFIKAASNKEEWGQFHVTRKNISKILTQQGCKIVENKVLHYKTDNNFINTLFHYKRMERYKILDCVGVMFMIAAIINAD